MSEELISQIEALTSALNAANDAYRAALAKYGIKTAADYFTLSENKEMRKQLIDAEKADLEQFEKLCLTPCGTVQ